MLAGRHRWRVLRYAGAPAQSAASIPIASPAFGALSRAGRLLAVIFAAPLAFAALFRLGTSR
jgi:hypothetical protein